MDDMNGDDQVLILSDMYPNIPIELVKQMVQISRTVSMHCLLHVGTEIKLSNLCWGHV